MHWSQTESSKCSLELHTSQVAPAPYWDAANEGLDLTFDKDRRRGTDLEGEGKAPGPTQHRVTFVTSRIVLRGVLSSTTPGRRVVQGRLRAALRS